MPPTTGKGRPIVDPVEVAQRAQELAELHARDPHEYAEALADAIMAPDPVESAAFRHEDLAFQSLAAAKALIEQGLIVLGRRRKGSEEWRATNAYLVKVRHEARLLDYIVTGLKAQRGIVPNAPNPRRRAERRLVNENLAGDVKQGRIRELIEEEKEADRVAKQAAKKERQAARKQRR